MYNNELVSAGRGFEITYGHESIPGINLFHKPQPQRISLRPSRHMSASYSALSPWAVLRISAVSLSVRPSGP